MNILKHSMEKNILTIRINLKDMDIYSIPEIQQEFIKLKARIKQSYDEMIIDMKEVEYADSSGISFLVKAHIETKKHINSFKLINLCDRIRLILEYANLTKDFDIAG